MKEYSTELTKMLSELEDPDVKRPTLRRFNDLDQEEREIYMKASKKQSQAKADDTPSNDEPTDIELTSRQYSKLYAGIRTALWFILGSCLFLLVIYQHGKIQDMGDFTVYGCDITWCYCVRIS